MSAHALAAHVEVVLQFSAEAVSLIVADDGQGFDRLAVQKNYVGHLGLMGMQERAQSLGGQLALQSSPGFGTQVTLVVPIRRVERVVPELGTVTTSSRNAPSAVISGDPAST